ncbi:SIR2 family protein [uncultured Roseivirga sp.]|uniref:SIR2 family protein n=1 Tax=uncultured Roseivirga sp. TaxID=543088 RepID=UPI0030DB269C|tara:strand:- start:200755 stop:203943 length:3189 start_codon:yes stop_codon:yes gene_type:complete
MEHILDIKKQEAQLHSFFETIRDGNTILFLGAGASVGEKRYLSKEVIEYYEEYLGSTYNEADITRFLDILSADPSFNRGHFDSEVEKMLRKLSVTEGHKILAGIPWREIITTNYDLLVEQAFDDIKLTHNHVFDLVPIRNQKEYNFREDNTQIKYVKLNGCISDKSKYPLSFSTTDFQRLNQYYKYILNDLKNVSPKITFLSAGYSYKDEFGQKLLSKFDSYNFRERRLIYNIDPFPNERTLPYYSQQRICIIKCTADEFFKKYNEWDDQGLERIVKANRISFTTSKNKYIQLPNKLAVKLNNVVKQLNSTSQDRRIKDEEFFRGEEPNYDLILRNVDVVKRSLVDKVRSQIQDGVIEDKSTFIPIFFLTGGFGIGKTTFTLRLIHEFISDSSLDCIAFEIKDFQKAKADNLIELIKFVSSKNVILYCDEVEIESSYKALISLRRELSIEQFNEVNLFFLVPVRENILAKYKITRDVRSTHEITLTGSLSDLEISELLEKLMSAGLIHYRDENEKQEYIRKIKFEYGSDSFISLLEIVTQGNHANDLIQAYNELSSDAQKAFLNTALLHRFKLGMPVSWLKNSIASSWEDFTEKVIKAEGKGILIQHIQKSRGLEPDIVFKTKHPIIAERLIQMLLSDKDLQFKYYLKIFRTVSVGKTNSFLVSNLLKSFIKEESFSQAKINKLFDEAYGKLSEDPHYCLNYAINLQYRNNIDELKKALSIVVYAESLLDYRNHRFTHRRGVINFELAKMYYKKENHGLNFTLSYLNEAKELFKLKQLLDPFSHYSYINYITLLIWELENIEYELATELKKRIQIEELFDIALRTVTDEISQVYSLQNKYALHLSQVSNTDDYKQYIDELYDNLEVRPYACILLFNHFEKQLGRHSQECYDKIYEMRSYMDNNEVVKFLFKYYGRELYNLNSRMDFFRIAKDYPSLEEEMPLSFYFFHFIAESYNYNFSYGQNALDSIKSKYHGLNPEFHYVWSDTNNVEVVFEAKIVQRNDAKYKAVKITDLQRTFKLKKGSYSNYKKSEVVSVKLHFYLYGIRAEIVKKEIDDEEFRVYD